MPFCPVSCTMHYYSIVAQQIVLFSEQINDDDDDDDFRIHYCLFTTFIELVGVVCYK